jgi:hypothetical protein
MQPEIKAKRKIEALERRRALIDVLIEFIRTHPLSVDGSSLIPLANRIGLRYDFAVIRPLWANRRMRSAPGSAIPGNFFKVFRTSESGPTKAPRRSPPNSSFTRMQP